MICSVFGSFERRLYGATHFFILTLVHQNHFAVTLSALEAKLLRKLMKLWWEVALGDSTRMKGISTVTVVPGWARCSHSEDMDLKKQ